MTEDIMEIDRAKEPYTCVSISTVATLAQTIARLQEQLNEKGLWIGVLKSHLEECWEIIKLYAEHDYLTPEDFYMRDRLERYYRRAGLGNIEDAKKLLEKWGVK